MARKYKINDSDLFVSINICLDIPSKEYFMWQVKTLNALGEWWETLTEQEQDDTTAIIEHDAEIRNRTRIKKRRKR